MNALPPPKERSVQRAIKDMLERSFPHVWFTAIPNGAYLGPNPRTRSRTMGILKGDGLKVGTPDLLCLWSPNVGAFIEVKRAKTGRVSPEQEAVHGRLEEIRWPVAVVTSVEQAFEFLRLQGAPWSGIAP